MRKLLYCSLLAGSLVSLWLAAAGCAIVPLGMRAVRIFAARTHAPEMDVTCIATKVPLQWFCATWDPLTPLERQNVKLRRPDQWGVVEFEPRVLR